MRHSDKSKKVTTDKHNEIAFWLYKKITSDDGKTKLIDKCKPFIEERFWFDFKKTTVFKESNDQEIKIPEYQCELKAHLEYPIQKFSDYRTVGYADLVVIITAKTKEKFEGKDYHGSWNAYLESRSSVLFEIKSKFNLGESVRQIKHYLDYNRFDLSYVVSPPHPHTELLANENIGFIEYKI